MFLTPEEIRELTHRVKHGAQAVALNTMGIMHKIRPDGSIVVMRDHVESLFGIAEKSRKAKVIEPNWSRIN